MVDSTTPTYKEIIEALRNDRHFAVADKIEEAVTRGSTGGEILMGVRYEINNFLAIKPVITKSLESKLNILLEWITKTGW
ncbi:MAG: hypothetical protein ABL857_00260 [Rickettsiales bacterium]